MAMVPERFRCAGFTYIGLLIFIALIGIGLALAGQVWHTAAQREKERELLFIGDAFRTAIASYYQSSPGGAQKYPRSLEDLLDDRRQPTTQRHLRRIYRDPMSGGTDWGLVTLPDGSITGVYSLSSGVPFKGSGFRSRDEAFASAAHYSDWKFAHGSPVVVAEAGGAPPPPATPGEAPPPPAGPGSTPTPVEPPPKPPTKCERIGAVGRAACDITEARWGAADADLCRTSSAARVAACEANQPIPPLYIRYQ